MGSNTSEEVSAVLNAVRRVVHALHESSRLAEKHVGLTGAQLFVLQTLAGSPGISVNELAARTHTHQSSVSTVAARLVDQHLVRRSRSAEDGRQVVLTLAPRGRRLLERAPDVAQHRLIRAVHRLPAPRRRALAATLTELVTAMDLVQRVPAMFLESSPRPRRRRTVRASRSN
jgi:DNA-binding MarR family transcriptional regulator